MLHSDGWSRADFRLTQTCYRRASIPSPCFTCPGDLGRIGLAGKTIETIEKWRTHYEERVGKVEARRRRSDGALRDRRAGWQSGCPGNESSERCRKGSGLDIALRRQDA